MAFTLAACGSKTSGENQTEAEEAEAQEGPSDEATLTAEQMKAVGIEVGKMDQRQLSKVIKANGQLDLDPRCRAAVTSLVAGVVRKIVVGEGNSVRAGQVVAYIENTDIVELQSNYITAMNELNVSAQDLARQKQLAAEGAGVKKTLQQAQAAHDVARARLSAIAQQLQQLGVSPSGAAHGRLQTLIPIKAPISGKVGKINAKIGSYADMQTELMTVVDNSKLHCNLLVFEKDVPHLRVGQTVDMVLTNDATVSMSGKIYEINSAFEDNTKAVKVHVSLPAKPQVRLMPEMYVSALINLGQQLMPAMPNEAIVSKSGKQYIYRLKHATAQSSTFEPVEVVTGVTALGYTAVTPVTPTAATDTFVKRNAFYISSMMEGEPEED